MVVTQKSADLVFILIPVSGSISDGASGAQAPLDFSKGTTGTTLTELLWHHH